MYYKNSLEEIIDYDIKNYLSPSKLRFRFPPEPNGYLHLGHTKAIFLNFFLGQKYNAPVYLRFDDTNPENEEILYIKSIKKDITWLGFKWHKECYTSDYFEILYNWAIKLIKEGKAYVDMQSKEKILEQKKNPFEKGIKSPYRNLSKEENLENFKRMKSGEFDEGKCVLRAKIDMNSSNMNLRDPIMYRIIKKSHLRTKDQWCIYPNYDWAHAPSDYIEQISHSFCSFEFENHRPLYDWYLDQIVRKGKIRPRQYEFSRLNLSNTIMSKRKLKILIDTKIVSGWDDPIMPTLSGLRRRGYTPKAILNFCQRIGVTKRDNIIELSLLEFSIREYLKKTATRVMVVLNPIKVILENFTSGKVEWLEVKNNTQNLNIGIRHVPFSRVIYIEKKDFIESAYKNFLRLTIGGEIRLKNAYIIKGTKVKKNIAGEIEEIYALYDPDSISKTTKRVKSTLNWVSVEHCIPLKAKIYNCLFSVRETERSKNFFNYFNSNFIKVMNGYGEPYLKGSKIGDVFQFQRLGYFCVDKTSYKDNLIFNMTVALTKKKL